MSGLLSGTIWTLSFYNYYRDKYLEKARILSEDEAINLKLLNLL